MPHGRAVGSGLRRQPGQESAEIRHVALRLAAASRSAVAVAALLPIVGVCPGRQGCGRCWTSDPPGRPVSQNATLRRIIPQLRDQFRGLSKSAQCIHNRPMHKNPELVSAFSLRHICCARQAARFSHAACPVDALAPAGPGDKLGDGNGTQHRLASGRTRAGDRRGRI